MYKSDSEDVHVSLCVPLYIILSPTLPFGLYIWIAAHVQYIHVYVHMGVHVKVYVLTLNLCVFYSHTLVLRNAVNSLLKGGGAGWRCTLPDTFTLRVNFHAFDYLNSSSQKHTHTY